MPVNPGLPRKVLIVHGVQTSADNLNQDILVNELIKSRIGNIPLAYQCELYRYKNIAAATLKKYQTLLDLLVANPVGQAVGDAVLQLAGDVVISLENGSTADKIRKGLRKAILDIYSEGNPCYIVAHSLGSIYTFDVINSLIGDGEHFDRASRKTWPVQGLLTIGSPIGLDMFKQSGRSAFKDFGAGDKWFRWLNMWDPGGIPGTVYLGGIPGTRIPGTVYLIQVNCFLIKFRLNLKSEPECNGVMHDTGNSGGSGLQEGCVYQRNYLIGEV